MTAAILQALRQLDVANNAHWTADGAPALATVNFFMGGGNATRAQVTAAAPGFSRATGPAGLPQAVPADTAPAQAPAAPLQAVPGATDTAQADQQGAGDETVQEVRDTGDGDADRGDDGSDVAQAEPSALSDTAEAVRRTAADLDELRRYRAQFDAEWTKRTAAHDAAVRAHEATTRSQQGGSTLSQNIADYHARQKELLAERAAKMKAIKDSGFKIADLMPQLAPIDRAMQRKTARGTQRPNFTGAPPKKD